MIHGLMGLRGAEGVALGIAIEHDPKPVPTSYLLKEMEAEAETGERNGISRRWKRLRGWWWSACW
jgi:hypothetical protein